MIGVELFKPFCVATSDKSSSVVELNYCPEKMSHIVGLRSFIALIWFSFCINPPHIILVNTGMVKCLIKPQLHALSNKWTNAVFRLSLEFGNSCSARCDSPALI